MSLSKELQIGKAGEHLVCADLIIQGHNAFLADQGLPYDVIVERGEKLKTVQVKTCMRERDRGKSKNVYRFYLKAGRVGRPMEARNIDYIAFVFLDIRVVQYVPVRKIIAKSGYLKQCIDFRKKGKTKYVIGKFSKI